jgi:hypothetical protein
VTVIVALISKAIISITSRESPARIVPELSLKLVIIVVIGIGIQYSFLA